MGKIVFIVCTIILVFLYFKARATAGRVEKLLEDLKDDNSTIDIP
jgi:hypothetical protein